MKRGEAASSDWKNNDCWQKIPRTQSHLAAGRMSDKTEAFGVSSSIPEGPARNLVGWPGVVEGHVHRLKLVKRQGYGRAAFPLLRKRVLYQAL
ncbi:MAG TPA: hypothetical protein VHZ51_15230 [Ktedonobacteraceae bacterium]|nr:hypothetical protein [Ktedonobacteraceae bacterium]